VFTRAELVLRFTLNAICDDYENLSVTIAHEVTKDGADCGVRIEKAEIVAALAELLNRGWAKAYRMDGSGSGAPPEIEGMPSLEEMEDFFGAWFYITGAGMKVQLADWEFWPFDDDNRLRKDWTPPLT
jgi:hypothetical protein